MNFPERCALAAQSQPDAEYRTRLEILHVEMLHEIERMRAALVELRERITGHPAYVELTEAEEIDIGGDTAELSYLARVVNVALRPNVAANRPHPQGSNAGALDALVTAERERCAALCDSYEPLGREGPQTTAYELARAIRGRDE